MAKPTRAPHGFLIGRSSHGAGGGGWPGSAMAAAGAGFGVPAAKTDVGIVSVIPRPKSNRGGMRFAVLIHDRIDRTGRPRSASPDRRRSAAPSWSQRRRGTGCARRIEASRTFRPSATWRRYAAPIGDSRIRRIVTFSVAGTLRSRAASTMTSDNSPCSRLCSLVLKPAMTLLTTIRSPRRA